MMLLAHFHMQMMPAMLLKRLEGPLCNHAEMAKWSPNEVRRHMQSDLRLAMPCVPSQYHSWILVLWYNKVLAYGQISVAQILL